MTTVAARRDKAILSILQEFNCFSISPVNEVLFLGITGSGEDGGVDLGPRKKDLAMEDRNKWEREELSLLTP